ncbi:MAG: 4Fe-4S binding protein [Candidatus Pacebacteria bacterium]|nr:4Fe-4S binding protein [Candidatus Paceibacterota bacterium]
MKLKTAKQIPIGGKIIEAGNSKEFKTGSWKAKQPVRDKAKCIDCMRCAVFCPDMAIKAEKVNVNGKEKLKVTDADMAFCKGCGICETECPVKAIKMNDVGCEL